MTDRRELPRCTVDWRRLERAIVDAAEAQGVILDEGGGIVGVEDRYGNLLDFSKLAREIAYQIERISK